MHNPTFMFVAGDPSGDQNTAPVIRQITKDIPGCTCTGIGGPMMQAEGFIPTLPFEKFNKMGYLEVLLHLPFFFKAKKLLVELMEKNKPDAVVLVDYYGFNLQIMKAAHNLNIPVIWYIIPKIWARKNKKRLTNLLNYTSYITTIFPFETDIFLSHTKNVSFVGNPLVEFLDENNYSIPNMDLDDLRKKKKISLALVPGSRILEIQNSLPIMINVVKKLKQEYPQISVKISRCGHVQNDIYETIVGNLSVEFADGPLEELFSCSDLAIVTSGTATLQAALMGIPMVIVYKTSAITFALFKMLASNVKYAGLPNIIANEEVVPEYLQDEMKPQSIINTIKKYIEFPQEYTKVRNKLITIKESLGSRKPSVELTRIIKNVSNIQKDAL